MFQFKSALAALALSALAAVPALTPAPALASDAAFFDAIEGQWSGPGKIVAGKYEGTRFSCSLEGSSLRRGGMELDGKCRVGLFSQIVRARVERAGRSYKGAFLDGAKGKGLDVVQGNVDGNRLTVAMEREELKGAMVAKLKDDGRLAVTVSVRVGEELVPVIGMDLSRRLDGTAVGSIR